MSRPAHILHGQGSPASPSGRAEPLTIPSIEDGQTISTLVITDFNSPEVAPGSWNSLVAIAGAPVYLTHEWQSSWWNIFGGNRQLNILIFKSGEATVGIAPLYAERGNLGRSRILGFIGAGDAFNRSRGTFLDDGPSDYLDIVADPVFGIAIGEAMAEYLSRNQTSIERLYLVNIRPESAVRAFVIPALKKRGIRVTESPGDVCPFVHVDGEPMDFIDRQSSGVRRRLNQAYRLLTDGGITLRENEPEHLDLILDDLMALHQQRWNALGFPGLFFEQRNVEFQKTVAKLFYRNGWLWYASLQDGRSCVAARLGFRFQGRMYEYLSGFDDSHPLARRRPGLSLWLAMYRAAGTTGEKTLDLLRGDEKYKFELTETSVCLVNFTVDPGMHRASTSRLIGVLRATTRFASFLLYREVQLYRVQVARYGPFTAVGKYLRFRGVRFTRKFSSTTKLLKPERN